MCINVRDDQATKIPRELISVSRCPIHDVFLILRSHRNAGGAFPLACNLNTGQLFILHVPISLGYFREEWERRLWHVPSFREFTPMSQLSVFALGNPPTKSINIILESCKSSRTSRGRNDVPFVLRLSSLTADARLAPNTFGNILLKKRKKERERIEKPTVHPSHVRGKLFANKWLYLTRHFVKYTSLWATSSCFSRKSLTKRTKRGAVCATFSRIASLIAIGQGVSWCQQSVFISRRRWWDSRADKRDGDRTGEREEAIVHELCGFARRGRRRAEHATVSHRAILDPNFQ